MEFSVPNKKCSKPILIFQCWEKIKWIVIVIKTKCMITNNNKTTSVNVNFGYLETQEY